MQQRPATPSDFFDYQDIHLSRIAADDFAPTVVMINEAYAYQDEAKGRPRTHLAHLKERATESPFYVAKHGDTVVGCVYIEPSSDALHFGLLTVASRFQGHGLAPAMLRAIDAYARSRGIKSLSLDYMSLAPWLKAYYERFEFHETGEVEPWGTINLVRMSNNLSE